MATLSLPHLPHYAHYLDAIFSDITRITAGFSRRYLFVIPHWRYRHASPRQSRQHCIIHAYHWRHHGQYQYGRYHHVNNWSGQYAYRLPVSHLATGYVTPGYN